ncbi:hypothetical protein F0562_010004 [Nyssa sinensis]|uniref:WRKY domain-containing protein n=1 Tax=Nyssa sinensis TaxID=561372 RepID=A0A5J5A2C7_9ASTE|nr:hypothetical protein F0562_010004 [Nyssa sinensis]
MEESQSQSQSQSSLHEDEATPSQLRLCGSNVESHVIFSSGQVRDTNSDAGVYSGTCAKYKLMSPAKLPISRSTCITIPPGLSPTSFLESPVLLSNLKAEPSPTTGSFSKPQLMHGPGGTAALSLTTNCSNGNTFDERKTSFFEFKPHTGSNFVPVLSLVGHASLASHPSIKSEAASSKELNLSAPVQMFTTSASAPDMVDSDELSRKGPPSTGVQASQSDLKDIVPSVTTERSSDDGYNWRKYGQKLVKGSEFPRSYYKCTHPNCEVKKIFERSPEGQITEIVYKGTHDHPKPQPTRRFSAGSIMSIQEKTDKISSLTGQEDKSTVNAQISHNVEPNGTPERSPCGANDDSVEGAVLQFNSTNDEVDEDDPFSKRRKIEGSGVDVTPIVKPLRESRVVVQTVSEVDILDDGYRWRKYGQKVVRGNPNPRSYYKCTNAGCPVRKHVERASHDPKAVITTYEGKHKHDVPTARTSSHDMAGPTLVNLVSGIRSEESDSISLDLGVGINSGAENRSSEQQQALDAEPLQRQTHITTSNFTLAQVTPLPTYYGVVNGGANLYVSRENHVESHRFETPPLNHPSNPYPQNLGSILLGP